jgi:hypothetical protein
MVDLHPLAKIQGPSRNGAFRSIAALGIKFEFSNAVVYKAQVPDVPAAGYRSICRPKLGTEAA